MWGLMDRSRELRIFQVGDFKEPDENSVENRRLRQAHANFSIHSASLRHNKIVQLTPRSTVLSNWCANFNECPPAETLTTSPRPRLSALWAN